MHADQHVDRNRFGMRVLPGQLEQECATVVDGLAHPDDAAAADGDAGLSHVPQRPQPVVVLAGGDDVPVLLAAGVEVVVVRVATRFLQTARLVRSEHAQRAAGFHAEMFHAANHLQHAVELRPVLDLAPGRAHAEACRAGLARLSRRREHFVGREQRLGLHAGLVAGRLRAVGAVLGASAGLDREERAELHLVVAEIRAVHSLRAKDEIHQRQVVDRAHFPKRHHARSG